MSRNIELSAQECIELIADGGVGRVALCTPTGPHIIPVNFVVDGSSVVFRTTPYSVVGTYGRGADAAFETDRLDEARQQGWSVVIRGKAQVIDEPEDSELLHRRGQPEPWVGGARPMYIRIAWREITGRRVGSDPSIVAS